MKSTKKVPMSYFMVVKFIALKRSNISKKTTPIRDQFEPSPEQIASITTPAPASLLLGLSLFLSVFLPFWVTLSSCRSLSTLLEQ